ncbi:MAG: glycosyltransferase family 2 protein [bacterium]|nr:glycosyltransferase family 2 protein [bacterium]
MDLSIIIVSWNVRKYLECCLASIAAGAEGLSFEVFVVDNASQDATREWLVNYESGIRNNGRHPFHNSLFIIHNSTNRGFAAANNQAIAQAKGKYILLLNPDTELCTTPNFVQHSVLYMMLRFMETHPRSGILGPKLLNSDGTLQPSVRRFPNAWGPLLFSLGMSPKRYLATDIDYTKAQQVDQVMGAAFLIRRELINAIGMLDEKFFIWFEEVDYCKRAKSAGWEVWYTPDAVVLHHGGESFAQVLTMKKQWMYSKSLLYYFRKHGEWAAYALNIAAVPFRLLLSLFV